MHLVITTLSTSTTLSSYAFNKVHLGPHHCKGGARPSIASFAAPTTLSNAQRRALALIARHAETIGAALGLLTTVRHERSHISASDHTSLLQSSASVILQRDVISESYKAMGAIIRATIDSLTPEDAQELDQRLRPLLDQTSGKCVFDPDDI